jgi:signal transduction histidine kinase
MDTLRPLSENRKVREHLALVDQLRATERSIAMAALASTFGHITGTPLNVISGRAALIRAGGADGAALENARRIEEQVQRLATRIQALIGRLLEQAAPAWGRTSTALLDRATAVYGEIAAARGVNLVLLQRAEPIEVRAAETFAVVVTSLLSLAARHAPPGSLVTVKLESCSDADVVLELTVPGMSPPTSSIDRLERDEPLSARADDRHQVLSLAQASAARLGGRVAIGSGVGTANDPAPLRVLVTWPTSE